MRLSCFGRKIITKSLLNAHGLFWFVIHALYETSTRCQNVVNSFSMLHGNNFDAIILLPRFTLKRYYNNTRLFSRSVKNSLGMRLSKFDRSRCHRSERLPLSMNTQRNHCARILLGRMETHAHRSL